MPDISLLQPLVLRDVVEKFTAPGELELLNRVPQTPWPYPSAQWDVVQGSRAVARPNVPNGEANVVPRLGRTTKTESFIYLREKKTFEPTTTRWLRAPGTDLKTIERTEAAVLRELRDLDTRFNNFAEKALWSAMTGTIVIDDPKVQASVDFEFPTSHKPAPGTSWATATPIQIVNDIIAWKRLVERDGQVEAKEAYASDIVLQYIFNSFAGTGTPSNASPNFAAASLLSDRMKDNYFTSGTIPGFMGLDWKKTNGTYNATGTAYDGNPTDPSAETRFLGDAQLFIGNYTDNRPWELMVGPSADFEAPQDFTGKFTKSWQDPDPSARQVMMEWNILPTILRPEQFVYVASVV